MNHVNILAPMMRQVFFVFLQPNCAFLASIETELSDERATQSSRCFVVDLWGPDFDDSKLESCVILVFSKRWCF